MVTELAFVLFITLFCLRASVSTILCLIFLLLPCHGTIKNVLFAGGGELFALWKEFAIMICIVKTHNLSNPLTKKIWVVYLITIIYVIPFAYIGYHAKYPYMTELKNLIFPCLLLIVLSKVKLSIDNMNRLFMCIIVGAIIINITGLMDFLSPTLRYAFRDIMKVGYLVTLDGTVYYDVSSFMIMGLDRVAGLMSGGPNQLGIFNSAICFLCYIIYSEYELFLLNKVRKIIYYIGVFLAITCLLLSFSRAGWAVLGLSIFIMCVSDKKKRGVTLRFVVLAAVSLYFVYSTIPAVKTVIDGTFSGEEASSAARGDMTLNSLEFLLENPYGFGLGASLTRSRHILFSESAMINMGVDMGLFGIVLLSLQLLMVYCALTKYMQFNNAANYSRCFMLVFYITSWVSVNPYENPFIYYAWFIMALGLTNISRPNPLAQSKRMED